MMNRYVIALNRVKIAKEQLTKHHNQGVEGKLSILEVSRIMDVVRKYPSKKIEQEDLLTCGFSKN